MLNLNDVEIFAHVVRAGSFAGAARRLEMPANSVSRRIQQLERELGARLFQRSTRKLTLTPAGSRFAERSLPAIDDLGLAAQEVMDGSRTPRGSVRVAGPADFLHILSMEAVAGFLQAHPEVRLEFILDDAMTDLVAEGVDVAFRGGPLADSRMVARRVLDVRHVLVASPAYLKRRGTPRQVAELGAHDCIGQLRPRGSRWQLQGPDGVHEVDVAGPFGANSARAVLQACLAGLGIALLPEGVVQSDLDGRRLRRVLPACVRDGGHLSIMYPTRHRPPLAVQVFVEFALRCLHAGPLRVRGAAA
jgi:DNA-binding transcriptional LysR family regulator